MKSEYALRAMLELAAAWKQAPLQSSDIASRRSIPESYLEQILTVLRRAGLVSSVRGPQGGHSLAVHPSRVTARDVIEAVDGPLLVTDGSEPAGNGSRRTGDATQELWAGVRAAMELVLERATMEDLLASEMVGNGEAMYHI